MPIGLSMACKTAWSASISRRVCVNRLVSIQNEFLQALSCLPHILKQCALHVESGLCDSNCQHGSLNCFRS